MTTHNDDLTAFRFYAGAALTGMLITPRQPKEHVIETPLDFATVSAIFANAMLAAEKERFPDGAKTYELAEPLSTVTCVIDPFAGTANDYNTGE